MAEKICSYSFQNTESYFVLDTNVNLRQLLQFFAAQDQLPKDLQVYYLDQQLIDDEHLANVLNHAQEPIHFTLIDPNQIPQQDCPQEVPEIIEEVKEEEKPFVVGEALSKLLERFSIHLDLTDIQNIKLLLEQLPFPLSMIIKDISHNSGTSCAIKHIAALTNLPAAVLQKDIQELLDLINIQTESKAEESEVNERNIIEERQEKPEEPSEVKHQAICDNCETPIHGIRYKCLHCPDYDLCDPCETINAKQQFHDEEHVFAKIYRPRVGFCGRRRMPMQMFGCPFRPHNRWNHQQKFPRLEKLENDVAELKQILAELKKNH